MDNMARETTYITIALFATCITPSTSPDPGVPPVDYTPGLTDLCPYTNLCIHTTNRSLTDPALQACCLPCSCSPRCAAVERCCPDAPSARPPSRVYPCRTQRQIYAAYLNVTNTEYPDTLASLWFRIIDGCPEDALQVAELTESVSQCHTARTIEDLVFVTGTQSGLTYLNKHCATCNHDNIFTEWNLYLMDRSVLTESTSFKGRNARILSSGHVMSVPVRHDLASIALCNSKTFKTCNETKNWDFYDNDIENKCHSLAEGVGFFTDYRCGINCNYYANVYCFLCNHPRGKTVPSQCARVDLTLGVGRNILIDAPFSALLTTTPGPDADKTGCGIGETLDPFHMTCTQLYCPTGSTAWYGACAPLVENEMGYIVYVAMQLVLLDRTDLANVDRGDIVNDVARVMMRRINNKTTACGLCDVGLIKDMRNEALYVAANLMTTGSCRSAVLLQSISRLFSSGALNVTLPASQLDVTLTNVKEHPLMHIDPNAAILKVAVFTPCLRGAQFLVNDTIFCPSIHLDPDNMRGLARYGTAFELITSRSVAVGNGTRRVCMADYEAILEAAGLVSGASQRHAWSTLLATVVVATFSL